jgi:hypothetical protein
MARFSFGKRTTDDEGIPPEPVEGEAENQMPSEPVESGGRPRRLLVIAGIGVILIGGLYLANILFFSTPAPPPARQAVPAPPAPTKEAAPAVVGPSKAEVKARRRRHQRRSRLRRHLRPRRQPRQKPPRNRHLLPRRARRPARQRLKRHRR